MNPNRCDAEMPGGMRCERDAEHEGGHYVSTDVPPWVMQMIAKTSDELEAKAEEAQRAVRRHRRAAMAYLLGFGLFVGGTVANIAVLIVSAVSR